MWNVYCAVVIALFGVFALTEAGALSNGPTMVFMTNVTESSSRETMTTLKPTLFPSSAIFHTSPSVVSSSPLISNTPSLSSNNVWKTVIGSSDFPIPTGFPAPMSSIGTGLAAAIPGGAAAGIVIGIMVLLGLTIAFILLWRRRKRHRHRVQAYKDEMESDSVGDPSPVKTSTPDPFLTDNQARGLGYDVSQQSTRRIEPKFMPLDYRSSSEGKDTPTPTHP